MVLLEEVGGFFEDLVGVEGHGCLIVWGIR